MGWRSRGDGQGYIQSYTQSYSKYFEQARVRAASGGVPAGLYGCGSAGARHQTAAR